VTGVDIVGAEGLIHVLVNVKSIEKDGSIFIGHKILGQALFAELF
jgi:hypothetical protein